MEKEVKKQDGFNVEETMIQDRQSLIRELVQIKNRHRDNTEAMERLQADNEQLLIMSQARGGALEYINATLERMGVDIDSLNQPPQMPTQPQPAVEEESLEQVEEDQAEESTAN